MPSRSALSVIPSGETPVSNSSVVVVVPRRTVTSAEKPCSARRPAVVRPSSNCGAETRPLDNGARDTPSPPVSSPSKTLSTRVVITTSSTGSRAIGSTAGPGAGRGAAVPAGSFPLHMRRTLALPLVPGHRLEPRDALLHRRVGGEQGGQPLGPERVGDHQVALGDQPLVLG